MNFLSSTACLALVILATSCRKKQESVVLPFEGSDILYTMPDEAQPHEGTWLQWPHQYQYGLNYRNRLDDAWVAMTSELVKSENVHIIAYNQTERDRIIALLNNAGIDLTNVDFRTYPNDDFWIRDNGPIYARDTNGSLVIQDWGFNGWGGKTAYRKCDQVPSKIASDSGRELVNLNDLMVNEGGAVEIDGHGALMATKSSILNDNRNPGLSQEQAEAIFRRYLGVTHFIWLEGRTGTEDITDQHIDGFARFLDSTTIITMAEADLLDFDVRQSDIDKLYASLTKEGQAYTFVQLPLTQNNVTTTYGRAVGFMGSYVNFYIANTVVLVPIYNDPNDATALATIQSLYPNRNVVGIDARNMYINGGMIHCVTQQQPRD